MIQGTGAAMWKLAMVKIFNWIKKNNYLNIIKLCVPVHDNPQLCRV
jgi:DNA polymerase I-like protein with 3'-5' exonuclease and polymerase domains